jgi:hypothetical protein
MRHPLMRDIVTLGECEPSRLEAMMGTEPTRSIVHLYYGSFVELAQEDPDFRLDDELRETVEHEIQHHLEDRAGVRTLIDEDDLFDAHQRFLSGLETPKGWWRRGERLERDVYAVESDLFVELRLRRREFEARRGTTVQLSVLGEPFEAEIPKDVKPGEILTFEGDGLVADEEPSHQHAKAAKKAGGSKAAPRGGGEGEQDEEAAGDLHLILDVR